MITRSMSRQLEHDAGRPSGGTVHCSAPCKRSRSVNGDGAKPSKSTGFAKPPSLICPITTEELKWPDMAATIEGQVYSIDAIRRAISSGCVREPATGLPWTCKVVQRVPRALYANYRAGTFTCSAFRERLKQSVTDAAGYLMVDFASLRHLVQLKIVLQMALTRDMTLSEVLEAVADVGIRFPCLSTGTRGVLVLPEDLVRVMKEVHCVREALAGSKKLWLSQVLVLLLAIPSWRYHRTLKRAGIQQAALDKHLATCGRSSQLIGRQVWKNRAEFSWLCEEEFQSPTP